MWMKNDAGASLNVFGTSGAVTERGAQSLVYSGNQLCYCSTHRIRSHPSTLRAVLKRPLVAEALPINFQSLRFGHVDKSAKRSMFFGRDLVVNEA